MAKYKDSFQTSSESLEEGGRGIVKAVRNEDPDKKESQAPPPKFDSPKNVSKVSPIRTLAEDMQTVTSEQNITLAGEALKRQDKKSQETPRSPRIQSQSDDHSSYSGSTSRRFPLRAFVIVLVLVVFLGSSYLFLSRQGISLGSFSLPNISMPNISLPSFSFFKGDPDTSEDGSNVTYETLIDTSSEKIFVTNNSTSRREFGEAILGSIDKAGSGGIHAIIPVKEVLASEEETKQVMLTPREVFSLLDLSVDSALARNIEGYTIGAIDTQSSGGEVFLLADIRSYDESFGALLDWEEDMASDLYNIFHQHRAAISSNNSFEDSTVRGYDARELVVAEDGTEADSETNNEEVERESILIYSLPAENKLILTRTSEALRDIILRLEE